MQRYDLMSLNILFFTGGGVCCKSSVVKILSICVRTDKGVGGLQKVERRGQGGRGGGEKTQNGADILYRWPLIFVAKFGIPKKS